MAAPNHDDNVVPNGEAEIPGPRSGFFNTLISRLASLNLKLKFGRIWSVSPVTGANTPTVMPQSPIVDEPANMSQPTGVAPGIEDGEQTTPAPAAYLTLVGNHPIFRHSRLWRRFVRVRTDDLQSVRAERVVERVRSKSGLGRSGSHGGSAASPRINHDVRSGKAIPYLPSLSTMSSLDVRGGVSDASEGITEEDEEETARVGKDLPNLPGSSERVPSNKPAALPGTTVSMPPVSEILASPSMQQIIATPLPPGTPEPSTPPQKSATLPGVGSSTPTAENQTLPTPGATPTASPPRPNSKGPTPADHRLSSGSDVFVNGSGNEPDNNGFGGFGTEAKTEAELGAEEATADGAVKKVEKKREKKHMHKVISDDFEMMPVIGKRDAGKAEERAGRKPRPSVGRAPKQLKDKPRNVSFYETSRKHSTPIKRRVPSPTPPDSGSASDEVVFKGSSLSASSAPRKHKRLRTQFPVHARGEGFIAVPMRSESLRTRADSEARAVTGSAGVGRTARSLTRRQTGDAGEMSSDGRDVVLFVPRSLEPPYRAPSPSKPLSRPPFLVNEGVLIDGVSQRFGEANEAPDALHSNALRDMASAMYERLIQRGCTDLKSSIDPHGFSSSAVAQGGFGDIWAGRHRDGTKLAIKVLRFTPVTDDTAKKQIKRATREIYNWSRLEHENIHQLMGVIMFQERLGMVSRWMDYGNLRQYLDKNSGTDRYQLCAQISKGMAYLHGVNTIHGDLKASNILVSLDGIIKLTDFDHSIASNCTFLFSETTRVGGGTLRWMAPELLILENPPQRNKNTDIYALGMTLLETMTNDHPYSECREENQILFKHIRKEHPMRPIEHFPDSEKSNRMWSLLVQCWNYDPTSRPTAGGILASLLALNLFVRAF